MKKKRQKRVRLAVQKGVLRRERMVRETVSFAQAEPEVVPRTSLDESVIGAMPRRKPLTITAVSTISPRTMRLSSPFRAGVWLTIRRLFVWNNGLLYFLGGILWDKLRQRDTINQRAVRLRLTFARIGGTFIKFGQQAAIRADLLPHVYCEELTKLLDKVDPFPAEQAIAAIERVTGKPLADTYQRFDPEPIGSASIACVYQAELHSGESVAVKVRRPGIGEAFVADFRVLGWLFGVMEALTIVRPGFTEIILEEVRSTLMEELDFYKEARFQEIFRRRAKKAKRPYFSAPRVYPQYSGEDVIVEEFASGIWLSELLSAVERNDLKALATIRELNIDPKIVAKRLLWVSYWGLWESVFFHADPHPANIIVQRNNKLVFIDFGSMGALKATRRRTLHEIYNLEKQEDLEGMARLALTLLEPLPPIDTEKVIKAIEDVYWEGLIATRSRHSEWWERTSAQLWLGFFRVTSRFQIPMSFDTVRMIRATLLYDTLAARLDHDIDLGREYRRYVKDAGAEARKRLVASTQTRLEKGLTGRDYLRIEQMIKMGEQAVYQANRLLRLRSFNFSALVGKFVSAVMLSLSLMLQLVGVTAVIVIAVSLIQQLFFDTQLPFSSTFVQVATNRWYQLLMGVLTIISIRRILFRLQDKEV
ncbi:MAG: AarF/ABC1/UbiB kinase family protein [Chloroflexi bacterium]|nr:MAG: AarF/ABC1/UbiB kinase family protein [Chloroflexota bacterium]